MFWVYPVVFQDIVFQVRNLHFLRRRLFRLLYLHSDHKGLGNEIPTVLRTNGMGALPHKLIDQYSRPMTIKNTIKNAIDCFHMEARSTMVLMKLDPDLQTTLTTDGLCRISGTRTSAMVWKTQR